MSASWHPDARDSRRASSSSTTTSNPRVPPSVHAPVLRPPPMAASMIHTEAALPYRSRTKARAPSDSRASDLTSLTRQQRAIEENLQALLDAQADALLAGLNGPPASPSSQASTITAASLSSTRAIPVRQPPPSQAQTLRATRRAIWDSMRSLTSLKTAESAYLSAELDKSTATLAQLDTWSSKRAGLTASIVAEVENSDQGDARAAPELRAEQSTLDEQIATVEAQLEELKSQRRAVSNELRTVENRVQARLSSFRGALAQVEHEINTFLRSSSRSPRSGPRGIRLSTTATAKSLEEAREEVETSKKALENQALDAEAEREALDEGAIMWNDVVGGITDFERALSRELRNLRVNRSVSQSTRLPDTDSVDAPPDQLMALMDDTIEAVENNMTVAESKGWNLLVVAIGAEHEALCHGRAILVQALNWRGRSTSPAVERGMSFQPGERDGQASVEAEHEDAADDDDASTAAPHPAAVTGSRTISPNKRPRPHQDDPDPDLLLSQ